MLASQTRPVRTGTIVPILALTVTGMFGFVALAIDLGVLTVVRTECQNSADSGALAGARVLNNKDTATDNDSSIAISTATTAVTNNVYMNTNFTPSNLPNAGDVKVGLYDYDATAQKFIASFPGAKPTGKSWSAVSVNITANQPMFFAKIFGISSMPTGAVAVAVHRPRDIAFVLDFTGSMGYDSSLNWPNGSGTIEGTMNPDPAYPQFGHYARYAYYQNTTPSGQANASPSTRPNPLQMKGFSGNYSPNNFTMETGGGPAMIEGFVTYAGNPASINSSLASTNAFQMWSPVKTGLANTTTLTPATFDFSGYPPIAAGNFAAAVPAPDNYTVQSDSPVAYLGDKWPRIDGSRGNQVAAWSTLAGSTFTDNGTQTLKQYLNCTVTAAAGRDLANITKPTGGNATGLVPNAVDGGTTDAMFLDSVWERYGYDIDMVGLRAQAGASKTVALVPSTNRYKGYSMGPGYWGKTPFVWPPDPRWGADSDTYGTASGGAVLPHSVNATNPTKDTNGNWICDWRRRFFLRGDGAAFDPQIDNINRVLFSTTAGHTLNVVTTNPSAGVSSTPGYYQLNYRAIIAWIKSGPQTLPTNVRGGRILYYSSFPDDVTESAAGNADDKRFLRAYIHYVMGVDQFDATNAPIQTWTYNSPAMSAGVESRNPFGTLAVTDAATFTPTGKVSPNREPYMAYTDNVNRPRGHFWFGPLSMLMFMNRAGENRPWWSGTIHQSQCWQLKASINSVLDDVRKNHPNDFCGLAFFANRGNFNVPLVPMGQDWFSLKNSLFFRKDTVAALKANPNSSIEHRPYNSTMGNDTAQIPNASGSTDPNSGLAVGFNLLSSSTSLSAADYGAYARKGAAKIVIFETDGIPNTTGSWSLTGSGVNTRYQNSGTAESWGGDGSLNSHGLAGVAIVNRIVAQTSAAPYAGYSTPNTPARVYSIAFGYLFNGYDGTNYASLNATAQGALRFVLRVQQVGNTSGPGDPPGMMIPFEQVITGPYQRQDPSLPESPTNPGGRIEKMRLCLERIMQSGIQVTLIQ